MFTYIPLWFAASHPTYVTTQTKVTVEVVPPPAFVLDCPEFFPIYEPSHCDITELMLGRNFTYEWTVESLFESLNKSGVLPSRFMHRPRNNVLG